jgi:hypothetical protein
VIVKREVACSAVTGSSEGAGGGIEAGQDDNESGRA